MNWLTRAVRRIGSSDAISWPVFWVTMTAGLIGNLVTTTTAPVGVRALTLVVGQIALWVPLLIARASLQRDPDRSRPGVVALAAVCGLMLRALVIGSMTAVILGEQEVRWSQRFVGALLNVGLAFVVSAFIVSSLRERRRQISELIALETALAVSVNELRLEHSQRHDETLAKVQQVLLAEFSALDAKDASRSLEVLQRTAADIVRPLSHQLAQDRDHGAVTPQLTGSSASWREVLDQAASGRPFRPGLTGMFMGIELLAATVAYPLGVPVFALMLLALIALLRLANAVLSRMLRGRTGPVRIGSVIVGAALIGFILGTFVRVGLGPVPAAPALVLGTVFFAVAFSLGVSVASAFGRDRERIVEALRASSRALQRRLIHLQQAHWFQQKAHSRALHGPIQTAVTAAALRLDAAIRAGHVDPVLVGQVRHDLLESLSGLESLDLQVASLDEAAHRLTATWAGLCEVSMTTQPGAGVALSSDIVLRSCVIDILTEAVSNAVRHGGATRADIGITLNECDCELMLTIASDSAAARQAEGPGLGSRMLDDCALEWRLEQSPQGMQLVVRLPVVEPPRPLSAMVTERESSADLRSPVGPECSDTSRRRG